MRILKLLPLISAVTIIGATLLFFLPSPKYFVHSFEPVNFIKEEEIVQKLPSQYCVSYGDKNAPINIVEYFSFQCPHCIRLFKEDFNEIKTNLIDTGKVFFEFHPVPNDLLTIQALICFELLSEEEKRLFLEVILEEADPQDDALMIKLMMTAMNVFNKPLPYLDDQHFLKNHEILKKSHDFIVQGTINAVPTIEVNGHLFAKEVPTYQFIKIFIKD